MLKCVTTNKTDRHDITEILLKVALKHHPTNKQTNTILFASVSLVYFDWIVVLCVSFDEFTR
jgi:hypothetical protein